jgi:hypothetical protein
VSSLVTRNSRVLQRSLLPIGPVADLATRSFVSSGGWYMAFGLWGLFGPCGEAPARDRAEGR